MGFSRDVADLPAHIVAGRVEAAMKRT